MKTYSTPVDLFLPGPTCTPILCFPLLPSSSPPRWSVPIENQVPKNPRFEQDEVQQDQDQGVLDKGVCEAGTTGLEVSMLDIFVNGRGIIVDM